MLLHIYMPMVLRGLSIFASHIQPIKLPEHPDDIQLEPTISAAPSDAYSEITDFTEVSVAKFTF